MIVIVFVDAKVELLVCHVWKSALIRHVSWLWLVEPRVLTTTLHHVVFALVHNDALRYILLYFSDEFIQHIIAIALFL